MDVKKNYRMSGLILVAGAALLLVYYLLGRAQGTEGSSMLVWFAIASGGVGLAFLWGSRR